MMMMMTMIIMKMMMIMMMTMIMINMLPLLLLVLMLLLVLPYETTPKNIILYTENNCVPAPSFHIAVSLLTLASITTSTPI